MTDEQINQVASDAVSWVKDSWLQRKYETPRYDNATLAAIYERLATIAANQSKFYSRLPADKIS